MLLVRNSLNARNKNLRALVAYLLLAAACFGGSSAFSQEEATRNIYAYIAIEPDIVTNYSSDNAKRLGYVRIAIEVMLDDPSLIPHIEHHMPRLRAKVIEIVGAQNEQSVRSLTGREEIRRAILRNFRDILIKETGDEIVKDVIFTKYLRQGG